MKYSNCLFEALKAKIKNSKVKVFKAPKEINDCCHFMWCDNEFYYHAYNFKKTRNIVFYEYKTKRIPRHVFESFTLNYLKFKSKEEKEKIGKVCGLKITKSHSEWDWKIEGCPIEVDAKFVDFYKKVVKKDLLFKVCKNNKMEIVDYETLSKKEGEFEYKAVDVFDDDWERLNRNIKLPCAEDLN